MSATLIIVVCAALAGCGIHIDPEGWSCTKSHQGQVWMGPYGGYQPVSVCDQWTRM